MEDSYIEGIHPPSPPLFHHLCFQHLFVHRLTKHKLINLLENDFLFDYISNLHNNNNLNVLLLRKFRNWETLHKCYDMKMCAHTHVAYNCLVCTEYHWLCSMYFQHL